MSSLFTLHHQKLGATFSNGKVPVRYGNVEDEYWAVRKNAAIIDLSHLGRLTITGGDRIGFLQGLLTNDIAGLKENQGIRACLLTAKARVLADMHVQNLGDRVLLDTGHSEPGRVKNTLEQFIITEDVQVHDSTDSTILLSVQGPRTADIINRVFRTSVSDLKQLQSVNIGPIIVVHHDRSGQDGYDMIVPKGEAEPVWQSLLLDGVTPFGTDALEILRIEAGIPEYGKDIDENTLVLEAGLKDAISFSKGCYLGQEVVARATFIGRVNRRLVQLQVKSPKAVPLATHLYADAEKEVGLVTSSTFSPALSLGVGLGYVSRDLAKEGADLTVAFGSESFKGVVTKII